MSQSNFLDRICRNLDAMVAPDVGGVREATTADDGGIIVALSGGPDSVALLLACRVWGDRGGKPVAAAHFNHLLRGDQSGADEAFCRDLCTRLDIPFFLAEGDPRPVARARGQGLEEAGRYLRRSFLTGLLAEKPGYAWVATGHHRDDQVETLLMRLFRGTGPAGMRGIRPRSGVWLHPLLTEDRREILAFLTEQEQAWRTDASNLNGENARARLRRELLPLARDIFGPGCLAGPARLAALWDDELALLDELTGKWLKDCLGEDKALMVSAVGELTPAAARRVLHHWLQPAGCGDLGRVHVENLRMWLAEGKSGSVLAMPGDLEVVREFDLATWRRTGTASAPLRFAEDYRMLVQSKELPDDPVQQGLTEGAGDTDDESSWRLTCPADSLQGNLQVRRPRPGDRIQPFGFEGTKKLSDLLREHRVGRDDRQNVLVVADEAGILWVVGLVRAERTRLLPSTARTVTISVVKRDDTTRTRDNN